MKKNTFLITSLIILLFTSISSHAQVVFELIIVPGNPSLQTSYNFELSDMDGTASDWGTPNMLDTINAIMAELVLIDDGTTPGVMNNSGISPYPTINDACDSSTWTQDLTGKIAVFYRGTCEFGLKAYNAQKKGAIGAIIINNKGGAETMLGGVYGVNVTIPYAMIGIEDGDLLVSYIQAGGVIGFLGNKTHFFTDDIASSKADILLPQYSAIPKNVANNGTNYPIDLGMYVYNLGTDTQSNVSASVDITFNGGSVYSQTSVPLNLAGASGNFIDTQYVDLGTYAPSIWNEGKYSVTYTINNTNDEDFTDNVFTFDFNITSNLLSKSTLDNLLEPISTNAYDITSSLAINDFWETCVQLKTPNQMVSNVPLDVDGITFSSQSVGESIANEFVWIKAYEWTDAFNDLNDPNFPNTWNLNLLASGQYLYPDNSLDGENIHLFFDNVVHIFNNRRYLFCIHDDSDSLKISFNNRLDYKSTINHYQEPNTPVWFFDSNNHYYPLGLGSDAIPALTVGFSYGDGVNENTNQYEIVPFPNPANNLLTIPIKNRKLGYVNIEVFDFAGKLIFEESKIIKDEPLKINVASISNGNYLFSLTYGDGFKDTFKVSINR